MTWRLNWPQGLLQTLEQWPVRILHATVHRAVERHFGTGTAALPYHRLFARQRDLTESIGPTVANGVEGRQNVCGSRWCFVIALTGAAAATHCYLEPELRLQAPGKFRWR